MKKIPTTEEFLKDFNKEKGNIDKLYYDSYIISFAKEFAKLHVEDALKKIADNYIYYLEGDEGSERLNEKRFFKEAYPLTNIK